ncbi:proton pump complex quinol oxidase subunit SoxA [Sulfolobus sp. E11-6]|uniref:proton pump complex quinol oxidase subunit SoxA n=1 Tax=Sulfolobus sp. E11-6 TaxID=2663020 RepID=UPI001295119C|nr:proton pump complex quinol oxidase subunit SoxA [Sulfolobus sp. E11-6]QGA68355.1 cytochrome c oxidase subunit II [Sulfolobus sp. E11-6]
MDIKEHAEEVWFIIMLILVATFFSLNVYYILTGKSFSLRYGLPEFSGLPPQAQAAVRYFETHPPPSGQYSEVINGTLVVNLTTVQYRWIPNVIVANVSEPVVLIINSPQVDTGFYLRLPNGLVNINNVQGITSYVYFIAPNQPGNYTWYNAEYDGYASSYMTGTLEVV